LDPPQPVRSGLPALAVAAVVMILVLPSCGLDGSCSDEDLRLAEGISHYGGAQPEFFDDPEGDGCAAALEVQAEAEDALDHYRRALEDDGWVVSVEESTVEGPEGVRIVDLSAERGAAEVTIGLEAFDGQVNASIRIDA
jgi:hypothetical protein